MADLLTPTTVSRIKRIYPHLDQVPEWATNQTLRLLWDRIHDLEERLQAAESNVTKSLSAINTLDASGKSTLLKAQDALITAGQALDATSTDEVGVSGQGGATGGVDDGLGSQGCSQAGADGHVAPGTALTAVTAGQIICGTGSEYSSLLSPTADLTTRESNQETLLERMIWHLQLAGFTAGRQINPSGLTSKDKLTVQVDGIMRAYDVFPGVAFTVALHTQMTQVFPAHLLATSGTADP